MRCVAQHDGALVEGLIDKMDLTAGEVANATMGELGGAARGRLREVAAFDQSSAETACYRVEGDAEASRAPADDEHVEIILQRKKCFFAGHDLLLSASRKASCFTGDNVVSGSANARLRAGRNWWMSTW